MTSVKLENQVVEIECPCCGVNRSLIFAVERGYRAVRCEGCLLIYVNPRPTIDMIDEGVRLGEHKIEGKLVNVRARRDDRKTKFYAKLFQSLFADRIKSGKPLTWVDYGAGYGEVLEAVKTIFPRGSHVVGVEPMVHKAEYMKRAGLPVINAYPEIGQSLSDVISMVNIFSHIPDFKDLLRTAASNLNEGGELFVETGNLADLEKLEDFSGILDLPDHLVFAGESQMQKYFFDTGFEIVKIERKSVDGWEAFFKNIVKRIIGRPVRIALPYSSKYRQLFIRAKRI